MTERIVSLSLHDLPCLPHPLNAHTSIRIPRTSFDWICQLIGSALQEDAFEADSSIAVTMESQIREEQRSGSGPGTSEGLVNYVLNCQIVRAHV